MDERINQALQNIEKDLQSIKSAREQVEEVVSDSSKLQEKVAVYVKKVSEISKLLEETLSSISNERLKDFEEFNSSFNTLKDSCDKFTASFGVKTKEICSNFEKLSDGISSSFEAKSNSIITDFEAKSKNAADNIQSEMSNLHDNIDKLNNIENDLVSSIDVVKTLNDDIEKLMKDLNDSQSAQDKDLLEIKNSIADLSFVASDIKSQINLQDLAINKITKCVDNDIPQILQNINSIKQTSNYLSSIAQEIKTTANKSKENIDRKFKTLLGIQIAIAIIILIAMFIVKHMD